MQNKDLQRQVNDKGKEIEAKSNNPEESKESKAFLDELRMSKEKLKEIEAKYQGEKQRNQIILSKTIDLENDAQSLGIDIASINQPKASKQKNAEEKPLKDKETEAIKNTIAELEKNKQGIWAQNKKKIAEIGQIKASISEEIIKSTKIFKDKEHECKQKEYEIKELKRNLKNLQTKLASVPDIHIKSDKLKLESKNKIKKNKIDVTEEDKPKEIRENIRKLSMQEEEEKIDYYNLEENSLHDTDKGKSISKYTNR